MAEEESPIADQQPAKKLDALTFIKFILLLVFNIVLYYLMSLSMILLITMLMKCYII